MSFHYEKCQVLCMSRSRKKLVRQYPLHGQALKEVDHIKCLGITLTSDATCEAIINTVTNKASRTLDLFRRTLKIGTKSLKEQAFKSFVRSLLWYACSESAWNPHNIKHKKSLEAIQRRAALWILHRYCRTSSANGMLTALNWQSLQSRHRRARLST